MSRVWHQLAGPPATVPAPPLTIESGRGAWVTDSEGRSYLDGLSGQWCVNLGYGRSELARVAAAQLERLAFQPLTRAHRPALDLADRLDGLLGGGWTSLFSNSGSEANELAFKVVRQHHQLAGEPGRFKVISRYRAYHGSTLGALSATGQALRRHQYEPLAPGFLQVPPPDLYRRPAGEDEAAYGERMAAELEQVIRYELPETVAAVILEPIITGGGVLVPPASYLPAVASACRRHGVLLIADEVICGFGRTGRWFGHEHDGIRPDVVTMAKGITSAYVPLAATLVADHVLEPFGPVGPARLRHINTFGGHPAGCAVALEAIAITEREELVQRSAQAGAELLARLRAELADHPRVGDVRGRGLLVGVELVADRATKEPVPTATSAGVARAAQERGLLVGRNADTAMGLDNVVALAPPLSLTDADLDHCVDGLVGAVGELA
jgi:taurine-pyruvate aminotransferase